MSKISEEMLASIERCATDFRDVSGVAALELIADVRRLRAENAELSGLLQSVVSFAIEAHAKWDADEDVRVGKMLIALAGGCPGYRPDTDAIHEALKL